MHSSFKQDLRAPHSKPSIILNIIIVASFCYFAIHFIYGERGLVAYFKLSAQHERAKIELQNLDSERLGLLNKTRLLRDESLDLDMLDQKAREILGLAAPDEQVFKVEE